MTTYIILFRGINVGGKNPVGMAMLRSRLEAHGYGAVRTYINSGNVIVESDQPAAIIGPAVEAMLLQNFTLDSALIRVLVLSREQLRTIVTGKPAGFGDQPDTYHSDIIFLMGLKAEQVLSAFSLREGVDAIWPGQGVVYSQRLSAERTKSRLNKVMASPYYQSMTIRNWNTTTKLLALADG